MAAPAEHESIRNPAREYLTRQQQNLLLAEPIARLSLDRRIFKDDPALADRLDVQYLALSAIDFVMERSAIESGALPAAIVDHVAREATRLKPALTVEQGRKVGRVVLAYDFDVGRRLSNLDDLKRIGFAANQRLLGVQRLSHDCTLGADVLDRLHRPALIDGQRASALRFGTSGVDSRNSATRWGCNCANPSASCSPTC